mmetsp:Transcript_9020/g.19296  ORF Transcript_9020/g.19296 Transcript_9020/m.19296 type:complete len:243 (-) Transcript_9020:39-767(-)
MALVMSCKDTNTVKSSKSALSRIFVSACSGCCSASASVIMQERSTKGASRERKGSRMGATRAQSGSRTSRTSDTNGRVNSIRSCFPSCTSLRKYRFMSPDLILASEAWFTSWCADARAQSTNSANLWQACADTALSMRRQPSLSKVWMASSRCGVTSLQTQGRGTALLGAGRPASQRFASLPALHFSVVSMLGSPKGAPALSQLHKEGRSGALGRCSSAPGQSRKSSKDFEESTPSDRVYPS